MLFNKENLGSEELYNLTGIFQASAQFSSIAAEIRAATNKVQEIVGSAVIKQADSLYHKNNLTDDSENWNYINAVRLPIAYLAIAMHSRISGLSHSETGRKLKVDDNEKIPFEWMVDRDDRELRERYYRSIDELIAFLEESKNPKLEEAPAKKTLSKSIVSSLDLFEQVYPIDGSYYMFYKISPLLMDVQQVSLKNLLGNTIYEKLVKDDSTLSATIKSCSIRFVVLSALVTAARRWSLDIFPLEVARRFAPTYQGNRASNAATREEIDWYIANLERQIGDARNELLSEINSGNPDREVPLVPKNDPRQKFFTV